jgi:Ca2+-binding RTX toxin-like protein
VDNAGDVVTENAAEGTDTVQASVSYTLAANVENLTLTGTDAINGTGNELDNIIFGNSGNNILYGGLGNDMLNGGTGADVLIGGASDDIYAVDSVDDVVIENADEGIDTVQSSVSYVLGENVEYLALTGLTSINGAGNELDNIIIGNRNSNILDGGLGADTMIGGVGDDTYIVDNIDDVCIEVAYEGIETVKASVTYSLGANINNLILTGTSNINGMGNSDANTITGNSGDNILDGGVGNDAMIGGLGNDTYIVDSTSDVVTENAGGGIDTVQSSITYTLGSDIEKLMLTGISDISGTGNSLNNILTGNSGANVLSGGTGVDTMVGGLGNDTYIVDNIGDVLTENAGEGIDTVKTDITYTLGANLENLTLTGTATINGTGNELDNVITGNSGANVLDGVTGADTMIGGLGDDTYIVDNSGDVIIENYGEGYDTVIATVSYAMTAGGLNKLILTGSANLNGTGNQYAESLIGNGGDNILDGGANADTMVGGLGNDTYIVDNIGDVLTENAGEGIDTVKTDITYTLGANLENLTLTGTAAVNGTGNGLDNVITGNSYNNVLNGCGGNDILKGGLGDDTYLFGVGSGNDTINSYEGADNGLDTLQFQNLVLASIEFARSNNDLVCTITQTGETVRLSNWTLGSAYQVATFQFTDTTLNAAEVNQRIA